MTPFDLARYARVVIKHRHEENVSTAWLTARLVTIGFHIPKDFPKSAQTLIGEAAPKKAFSKEQWEAAITMLAGPNAKPTPRPPLKSRLSPRKQNHGN